MGGQETWIRISASLTRFGRLSRDLGARRSLVLSDMSDLSPAFWEAGLADWAFLFAHVVELYSPTSQVHHTATRFDSLRCNEAFRYHRKRIMVLGYNPKPFLNMCRPVVVGL